MNVNERERERGGWNQTFGADDGQGGIVMGRDGGVAVERCRGGGRTKVNRR